MNRPTVSIIVPTYDRVTLLPRALDSIIAQTFNDWEIVLVDDGSTDETDSLAWDYASRLGPRFNYVRQSHAGSSAARNRGIEAGRGRFVAFLDSDDEFLPGKLERQMKLFELKPELGFAYSDFSFIDDDGVRHHSAFDCKAPLAREVPFEEVEPGLCVCRGSLFDVLIRGYFIATIVGMVRRELLGRTIRFPVGQSYAEEWLFYLQVARACQAGFVNEPLCLHHFITGSLARTDKHRNLLQNRELLYRIKATFPDLSRSQRKAVHRNLARTCRQLGFEAYRARRYRAAGRYFAESFRYETRFRTAGNAVQAAMRWTVAQATEPPRAPDFANASEFTRAPASCSEKLEAS